MHKIYPTITLLFCLTSVLAGQTKSKEPYQTPLKIASSFSGGFGELRRNHFHTGLDFRTTGQTGLPVYAAESGTVARVSVSPSGYGHALYLLHADGHTTVYGHLSRFHPKIESYVETQQYLLKQFAVDLTLPAGLMSFQKGELIAWSGNTGSSGGPHLHFEAWQSGTNITPAFLPDSGVILQKTALAGGGKRAQRFRSEVLSDGSVLFTNLPGSIP